MRLPTQMKDFDNSMVIITNCNFIPDYKRIAAGLTFNYFNMLI